MSLPRKPGPGIYRKYSVKRLGDKAKKHAKCEYFVLDWKHDPFAVPAALAYASACETEYPELAADLRSQCEKFGSPVSITPLAKAEKKVIDAAIKYGNKAAASDYSDHEQCDLLGVAYDLADLKRSK